MEYKRVSGYLRHAVYPVLLFLVLLGFWVTVIMSHGINTLSESDEGSLSGIRLIWAWSVDRARSVDEAVAQAQDMGFNAVGWSNPAVVQACHERGMKAFALVNPLSLQRVGALPQVLAEGEDKLPGFDRSKDDPDYPFQHGGEPVPGNREILHVNLACPRDPGVVDYGVAEAIKYDRLGYDGICWDFIGYRNYRSCECVVCRDSLANLQASGAISPEDFYLSSLTSLYSRLFSETRKAAPGLLIATHIYPVYLPDIHYGMKLSVDYCGDTVAWFFQPHWAFGKIREYTGKTLDSLGQMRAMPMIGFYSDREFTRDRKNPERLKGEFQILRTSGAKHFMMCELGHLLRDAVAMEAVRASLAEPRPASGSEE